jgi:phosphoserine phosphatase
MKKNENIILIDICGTMFDSNTTFDFLDWYVSSKRYKLFRKLSKTWLGKLINFMFRKLWHVDMTRFIAIRFLRGYDRLTLLKAAYNFYDSYLSYRKLERVFDFLNEFRRQGYKLVVVSATIDVIAEVIVQRNDIPCWFSSTLHYTGKKAICTGRIGNDLLGQKLKALQKAGIYPPFRCILTDDISDMDVIKQSKSACIVINNKTKLKWNRVITSQTQQKYQLIHTTKMV